MKCVQCGSELVDGALFCRVCDTKVENKAPMKFCPNCGEELVSGASFCRKCGYDILNGEYNDHPDVQREEVSEKKHTVKDKILCIWNGFDWAMQAGMIFCGIIGYLFVLALLANNWVGVWISVGQLVVIGVLLLIHFGKIRMKQESIKYVLIGIVVALSVLYLKTFHMVV